MNTARCPVNHYQRDGAMAGAGQNFSPNDGINNGATLPEPAATEPPMSISDNAWLIHYDTEEDHYSQTGNLFKLIDESQKNQLAANIADGLVHAEDSLQARLLAQFSKADTDYANRVRSAMQQLN